ncbi:MAG: hypothetical protein ACE5EX_10920 [Phycisphaerae bacterium]
MMRRVYIPAMVAVAVLGLGTFGTLKLLAADTARADCPGKIVCPQTGELICRDRCPTTDPNRPDCPGRITCPQTGEPVCLDRCPLGAKGVTRAKADQQPSCCQSED